MGKYKCNVDYFECIDSSEKAYWLGFLCADGCINIDKKNCMNLELSLAEKDLEHIKKFVNCVSSDAPIREKVVKRGDKKYVAYRVNICNTKFCEHLCRLGCYPKKTYSISFPTNDQVPQKYIKDYIRGFFDGDGCISITYPNNTPHIVLSLTGIDTMLNSIIDYLFDNGVISTIPTFKKDDRRNWTYNIYFHGTDSIKTILDYLYGDSTLYLERKYKLYTDFYKDYDVLCKRGVYLDKNSNKYVATICINSKRIVVGKYDDINDAIYNRVEAEKFKTLLKQPA